MKKYLIFIIVFFSSCDFSSNNTTTKNNTTKENSISVSDLYSLPDDFIKKYEVVKVEDLSYGNIKRTQLRITIPSSLNKSEVGNNIIHAIAETYNKSKPDGISVLVFEEGDNTEAAYSVAMGEFAPEGDWSKISSDAQLETFRLKTEYKEPYFNPKTNSIGVGSTVKLYKETAYDRKLRKVVKVNSVPLSNSAREWVDENIIVKIPNNTEVKILEIHKEKLTDGSDFIRYYVEAEYNEKTYKGWVHSEECIK